MLDYIRLWQVRPRILKTKNLEEIAIPIRHLLVRKPKLIFINLFTGKCLLNICYVSCASLGSGR